jgi:hypothetical protein
MTVPLCAFAVLLAWFHTSEFALAACFNWAAASWNCERHIFGIHLCRHACLHPTTLHSNASFTSRLALRGAAWLFSWPYSAAMLLALTEYALEHTFSPWIDLPWVTWCGVGLAVFGDAVRKVGILTAGSNFTHKVAFQRREGHALVTNGIYRCELLWSKRPSTLTCPRLQRAPGVGAHRPRCWSVSSSARCCLQLGAAPWVPRMGGVGSVHPGRAVQPAVHGAVRCRGEDVAAPGAQGAAAAAAAASS